MSMFDTEEELNARRKTKIALMILVIGVIVILFTGNFFYQKLKPLPYIDDCEKIGYETGLTDSKGRTVCYKDCIDKIPQHCKKMTVLS